MKNPFKAIVGGLRAGLRKADDAISAKRDGEIREMTKAATLEALETVGEVSPVLAALLAGKRISVTVQLQVVDEAD